MLVAIATAVVAAAVIAYTDPTVPHDFSPSDCTRCHYSVQNNPKLLTAPVTRLCKSCHRQSIRASSHPVDVRPDKVKVPDDLPLRNEMITCITCHDIHSEDRLVFGIKSYFLRRPTSDMKFFCISCHQESRTQPGHSDLLDTAHMGSRYRVTEPGDPIDPMSLQCISCHDGTIGSGSEYTLGEGEWEHQSGAHPIGVHYRTALMRNDALAPVEMLDSRLRFFAGKIGCGTCHDTYSPLSAKLIMGNEESKLCRSCHFRK